MSDLAQILLLPPPTPPQQRPQARDPELAVNGDPQQQGGDAARGRRFRFRVHEGGEGNTDIATRRTDSGVALNGKASTEDATGQATSMPTLRGAV